MCLVALYYRAADDAPIVVGANREEAYVRAGDPPRILDGPCRIVAGIDPVAGGTWFGVNERGLLVAVTNRRKSKVPLAPRSRGLLTRELLGCADAAVAVALATRELDSNCYAGCNLLCADSERAVVLHGGDWLRVRYLPPGLHVLANDDINDESDPRVAYVLWQLSQRPFQRASQCLEALTQLCPQTEGDGPAVCIRKEDRGTVSSSLVALRERLSLSVYLHAQGPPDRTPYEDYSELLRQLDSRP